jgi:hypothetical protein
MTATDMTSLVAPLVWRQQSHDCHVAKTAFGDTAVQNESHALAPDRWGWWMVGSDEDDSPSGYAVTIEAAKAAAQADYASRSALALDPAALAAMMAEARVKALREVLDAMPTPPKFVVENTQGHGKATAIHSVRKIILSPIDKEPKT